MEKRIVISAGKGPNGRYYGANFKLSINSMELGGSSTTSDEKLIAHYGDAGGTLCIKLKSLTQTLPVDFHLNDEYLHITKNIAVDWNEIEPQLLDWMKESYGDFVIRRESWTRRLANWFHWTFSK